MMLERICFSVLESSLVASVLYALMMLGEGRLAKYSPHCRSTLWFILSARLLVPLPVGIVYFGDSFAQAKWQLLGRVWLAGMAAFFAPSSAGILSFEQAAQPRGAPSFFKPRRAAGDSAGVL